MHLVIVTSMLKPLIDTTLFTLNQRITQTLKTLKSIKEKIPDHYIIMVDGSAVDISIFNVFRKYTNYIHHYDISILSKSTGEACLLVNYLSSDHFKSLKNVETISKLSGRYFLLNKFNWDRFPKDKIIIKFCDYQTIPEINNFETRYYRIPYDYVDFFVSKLKEFIKISPKNSGSPPFCIEVAFNRLGIIQKDKYYDPEFIGVGGLITGNREFIYE